MGQGGKAPNAFDRVIQPAGICMTMQVVEPVA